MNLEVSKYKIKLIDESNYSVYSTDNLFQYEQEYYNEREYRPTTQIGIKVYEGESIISNAIIRSTGGSSTVHKT